MDPKVWAKPGCWGCWGLGTYKINGVRTVCRCATTAMAKAQRKTGPCADCGEKAVSVCGFCARLQCGQHAFRIHHKNAAGDFCKVPEVP